MWWLERAASRRLVFRLACIGALGALVGGCFQPLYGEHSFANVPGIGPALAGVDVEVRNQLLFNLTGGGAAAPPTHRLTMRMTSNRLSVIVDITTGRPDVEDYGLNVNYQLLEIKSGKTVFNSDTFARVSYDIPGQTQRFARARGLRDAENRAAKLIADNIKARLASFFVAGT